ncbi:MAG: repeat protein [Clostridiales bacterium]|nr:repeat protein [Clostridiales bacterium]
MKSVEWKEIDEISDSEITYLLYMEGKDIKTISKIRNMEKSLVEKHIIECKIKYRAFEGVKNTGDIAKKLMRYGRDERLSVIERMSNEDKFELEKYAKDMLFKATREECSFYIWLLGEFKSKDSIASISTFLKCSDGNIKRISCSALGKIGTNLSEDALINCLNDNKPQVRQYAIKALGKIKSNKALEFLRKISNDKTEKDYCIRAALQSIEEINGKGDFCD